MADMTEIIQMQQECRFEELAARGVAITDGKADWKEGWGKAPFGGHRAHYFAEVASDAIGKHGRHRFWVAKCGAEAVTHDKAPMFNQGSYARCKNCERKVVRGEVGHG